MSGQAILVRVLLIVGLSYSHIEAEHEVLSPQDPSPGASFGTSLAVDGEVLIVGAPGIDQLDAPGAAYVFRRFGTKWVQEQKLVPSGSIPDDAFGAAVDVSGDRIIVGMPSFQFTNNEQGGAVIFRFNGTDWIEEQFFLASSNHLGVAVAIKDSWAAVQFGVNGQVQLHELAGNTWVLRQTLGPFFSSGILDLDQTRLLVRGNNAAIVFRRDNSTWIEEQVLAEPGLPSSARFGRGLALDGSNILVGAAKESNRGAAYWFRHQSGTWSLQQHITPYGPIGVSAEFGDALAMKNGHAVIGAPVDKGLNGTAWGYRLCDDLLQPELRMRQTEDHALFGFSVALTEDEYLVGSSRSNGGQGAVFVFSLDVDCDADQEPDGCTIAEDSSIDCNANLILDNCEAPDDCNANGLQDICDLHTQTSGDCNNNLIPDECDIAAGKSADLNNDGIPDECFEIACEDPSTPPTLSLMAVARNGESIPPQAMVVVDPNDVIDAHLFVRCWGNELHSLRVYEANLNLQDLAEPGTFGRIVPVGWDAPLEPDPCPCDDPDFPVCTSNRCVSMNHQPDDGMFIDILRDDFVFHDFSVIRAVDSWSLDRVRIGATTFKGSATDIGVARYAGTLRLVPTSDACGTFVINLLSDATPHPGRCTEGFHTTVLTGPDLQVDRYCPAVESLEIRVCEDDGLFCNGLEHCDAELGCQITPPPNCDDGVSCTVDACDEAIDGCSHVLNHAQCDDGDHCTRDECTRFGCVHIDDLCGDIPATSQWGLAVLVLGLLIMAKLRFRPRFA